jgi:uncharacterized protein YjbI with pentapeptide repeats
MNKTLTKRELRERWGSVPKFNIRESLLSSTSPFGNTHDGYLDLRGVTINDSLHKLAFSHVDFSCCLLDLGQFVSDVTDCIFNNADLKSFMGVRFSNCSFFKAKMVESWMRGEYSSCCFDEVDLSKRSVNKVLFFDCSFQCSRLCKTEFFFCTFDQCILRDCKLGNGSFAGSVFNDCVVEGLDLSTTFMERVKGLDLNRPAKG